MKENKIQKKWMVRRSVSKKILKKVKTPTVVISKLESYSVLGDPNRYFKDEYQEDKRSFYFK